MNRRDFPKAESLSSDLVPTSDSKPLAKMLVDQYLTQKGAAVPAQGAVIRRVHSDGKQIHIIEVTTSYPIEVPPGFLRRDPPAVTRRPPVRTPYLEDGVFVWLLGGVTVFMLAGAACLLAMMFAN